MPEPFAFFALLALAIIFVLIGVALGRRVAYPVNCLGRIAYAATLPALTEKGAITMYVVKADHPDVRYAITLPRAADSEGNPISTSDLAVRDVRSDNADAVTITPDNDTGLAGTVHFGKPNADGSPAEANITAKVINVRTGEQVGTLADHFTIPPGDPVQFVGGGFSFEGLNVAPAEPEQPAGEIEQPPAEGESTDGEAGAGTEQPAQ